MPEIISLEDHYDTIVAGAGPAGVFAALGASRRGRTLLVDSSALPRDKSCGGMLNEYSQGFLESHAALPASMLRDPSHVHFRYVDWDRSIRKPTELRFLNVDRIEFDEWLLSLLPDNVDIVGSTAVSDFADVAGELTVSLKRDGSVTQVTCDNLVGADGARSTVRRQLKAGSVATYVTLQDFVQLEGELEPYFDCIYMRDIGDSYAYSYVVPKGDIAIVGSVYYPKTKRPHIKQDQTLSVLRGTVPALGQTVKREASVALYVRGTGDVVTGSGRVLLAGEAGGFMSPTSGEGISYALNSGYLAGEAIAASSPDEALGAYTKSTSVIARNIHRKLKWLPFMESDWGKYAAGFVPTPIVSRVTRGL